MIDSGVEWEIDNKTCTACVYYEENIHFGEHCSPCSLPKDAEDYLDNFNMDTVDNIINRLIGE